jgi:hypothetical protein
VNPSQSDLMEQMTEELYRRFVYDNAERWHKEAEAMPWISVGQYDARSAIEWAHYFEDVVPVLRKMIEVLQVHIYTNYVLNEEIIVYRALESGWIGNSESGGLIEHRRLYETEARVSHFVLDNATSVAIAEVQAEVEKMLAIGLTDMFEDYLAKGLCTLVPIPEKAVTR